MSNKEIHIGDGDRIKGDKVLGDKVEFHEGAGYGDFCPICRRWVLGTDAFMCPACKRKFICKAHKYELRNLGMVFAVEGVCTECAPQFEDEEKKRRAEEERMAEHRAWMEKRFGKPPDGRRESPGSEEARKERQKRFRSSVRVVVWACCVGVPVLLIIIAAVSHSVGLASQAGAMLAVLLAVAFIVQKVYG